MLISELDSVKFLFEALDVLFLGHFHLLENFFLSVQLSVEIFCSSNGFVYLMLELQVLLLEDLNLAVGRVELDLAILEGKHLVFELRTRLKQS